MPTRLIPQTESMGTLLQQPETAQSIHGQHPRWGLQRKQRGPHEQAMADKHVLREGFSGFYGNTESVVKIGDTVRKHITRPDGQEAPWRPSCRPLEPTVPPPKAYGKRSVAAPGAGHHEEVDDLPRGKRRVAPPQDQLPGEAPMFQLKHSVRDPASGQRVADKVSDMSQKEKPRAPKSVAEDSRRNGIGQATPGDKPYAAVEVTSEYASNRNPARPRLNVEPVQTRLPPIDRWAAQEQARVRQSDIDQVRSLPTY
eukprot:CAMPEP_0174846266 /NCGR_PEP_ID=MMETSP1114-20130205/12213_1 /TAXON_ID=312471 /ORGANISM="Neobodo designis, Strain CCAP 1951/1" /LENGTH=254 /DNA_ID=CAMNT_0016080529 /DNA_START=24 /DNA_END=788 /DNA_ORIENTATION=+